MGSVTCGGNGVCVRENSSLKKKNLKKIHPVICMGRMASVRLGGKWHVCVRIASLEKNTSGVILRNVQNGKVSRVGQDVRETFWGDFLN